MAKKTRFIKKMYKRYKKKKKFSPSKIITKKGMTGIPDKLIVKLKYVETLTLGDTTTSFVQYLFRANSVYAPNATSPGHQPLYFDQYAELYNSYKVLKSAIKVTYISQGGNALGNMYVSLDQIQDASTESSINNMRERPGVKTKWLTPQQPVTLTTGYNHKRTQNPDQSLTVAVTQNPSWPSYFRLGMFSASATAIAEDVAQAQVEIIYTVLFSDIAFIAGSTI